MKVLPGYFLIIVTDCWGLPGQRLSGLHPDSGGKLQEPLEVGWPVSPPGRLAFTEYPTCAPTGWEGATYQPGWPGGGGEPEDATRQICNSLILLLASPHSPGPWWVLAIF